MDEVELWVLVLCRPDEFFNTELGNRFLYGSGLEDRSIVMLKQERDKHKLQTQSWKKSLCAVAVRFPHIVT